MKNLEFLGFANHSISPKGVVMNNKTGKVMSTQVNRKGYTVLALCGDSKRISFSLHRLLSMAYIITEYNFSDVQVNHIDGDKTNNSLSNLEWCTLQGNIQHSIITGLRDSQKGYTEDQIHTVCRLLEQGYRNKDVSDMTGVHSSKVAMIKRGNSYRDIYDQYNIQVVSKSSRIGLDKVMLICQLLSDGVSMRQIHKNIGVGYQTVRYIYKRQSYTDISKDFSW